MLRMSYGNGALFCFMRVGLVVHGVCCQQSSARTSYLGQSNTSLRGCFFVTVVSSRLQECQVLLIRGEGKV